MVLVHFQAIVHSPTDDNGKRGVHYITLDLGNKDDPEGTQKVHFLIILFKI